MPHHTLKLQCSTARKEENKTGRSERKALRSHPLSVTCFLLPGSGSYPAVISARLAQRPATQLTLCLLCSTNHRWTHQLTNPTTTFIRQLQVFEPSLSSFFLGGWAGSRDCKFVVWNMTAPIDFIINHKYTDLR